MATQIDRTAEYLRGLIDQLSNELVDAIHNGRDSLAIGVQAARDAHAAALKTLRDERFFADLRRAESTPSPQPTPTDEAAPAPPRPPIDPMDAIGLLRSYSRHRDFVRLAITLVAHALERRAIEHDASKMMDDEFAGFSRINAAAREQKFGTPEYHASMDRERATIDLHFSRNRHHPERPKLIGEAAEVSRGLPDDCTYWSAHAAATMNFLDIIEMVCDWWGARLGYADSRTTWLESVNKVLESKGRHLSSWQIALARDVANFLAQTDPERAK